MRGAPPPAGGISVLLTDMLTDDDWRQAITFLKYCKQDSAVLQMITPSELEPTFDGPIRLVSAEDEPAVEIAATPAVLDAYKQTLGKFIDGVKSHCFSLGAAHLLVNTSEPLEKLMFEGLARAGVVR